MSRFCSITSLGPKNIVRYVEVGQIEVPLYKLTRTIVLTKAVKINKQIKVIEIHLALFRQSFVSDLKFGT